VSFAVKLGWERDPVETQKQLLDAVFLNKAGRGFQIFKFPGSASQDDKGGEKITYAQKLETIGRRISDEEEGGYLWVVGNRGTGKTEAIIHLMREVLSNPSSDPSPHKSETRIPIFVSAIDQASRDEYLRESQQEDKGQFDWSFIDFLARRSLAQSLQWIAKTEQAGKFFPELRAALNKDTPDGYSKNWEVADGLLKDPDYTLDQFLNAMKTVPGLAGRIKPLLLVDDLDKQPYAAVQGLLSRAQPSVQSLVKNNVLFVFSVKPIFMNESRGLSGLNYLLEMSKRGNSRSELWVPEVAELRAVDLQDFLKHRLGYLVQDPKGGWRLPLQEIEGEMTPEEVEGMVSDWPTYNILNLRENGSMRVLTGWLTHIDQTGVRALLRLLQPLLIETPDDKELGPRLLLKMLKQNDSSQAESIRDAIIERIQETEIVPGWLEEESRLMDDPVSSANYSLMINAVKDKVSTGRWFGAGWKSLSNERHKAASLIGLGDGNWPFDKSLQDIGRFASPNRLAMELAWQLETEADVLPNVHSRTPEQFFQLLKSNPGILQAARNEAAARELSGSYQQDGPSPAATTQEGTEEPEPEPEPEPELTFVEECYKDALINAGLSRVITKLEEGDLEPDEIGLLRLDIPIRLAQKLLGFESLTTGQGNALTRNAKENPTTFGRKILFWMLLSTGVWKSLEQNSRERDLRILRSLMKTMEATNLEELQAFLEVKDEFEEWVLERQEYLEDTEEDNHILRSGHVDPEAASDFSKWQIYLSMGCTLPGLANWLGADEAELTRSGWMDNRTVEIDGRLTLLDFNKESTKNSEGPGRHAEIPQAISEFYRLLDQFDGSTPESPNWFDTSLLPKDSYIEKVMGSGAGQIWSIIDITSSQRENPLPEKIKTPHWEGIDTGKIRRSSSKLKRSFTWIKSTDDEDHQTLIYSIIKHFRLVYKIDVDARLYCDAEHLWEKILENSNTNSDAWVKMQRRAIKRPLLALSREPRYFLHENPQAHSGKGLLWGQATIYYNCKHSDKSSRPKSSGETLCIIRGPSWDEKGKSTQALDYWSEEEGDA
jgi:hypothetical protein